MKKFLTALFSLAAFTFAENIQLLSPVGAEFAPDAPNMVQSIVRASVSETGNTPVEEKAEIQLRTNIITMGGSIVVVCEKLKNGTLVASGKQKSHSIDNLDEAIDAAVKAALSESPENASEKSANAEKNSNGDFVVVLNGDNDNAPKDANDNFAHKRPTRNYVSYGLGMAFWHNYNFTDSDCNDKDDAEDIKKCHDKNDEDRSWEKAFAFHYARIFEVIPQAAVTLVNNTNVSFGSHWEWNETLLLGGRFFPSTGVITPFVGLGLGLGIQFDGHYEDSDEGFAIGLAAGTEAGIIFFRNSATQLEIGVAWDALWDGFDDFDRRFGSISAYIAINY